MNEQVKAVIGAIVVLVVEIAGICGVALDTDTVTQVVSAAAILVAAALSIWKNFNFTEAAGKAQEYLDALKSGEADEQ